MVVQIVILFFGIAIIMWFVYQWYIIPQGKISLKSDLLDTIHEPEDTSCPAQQMPLWCLYNRSLDFHYLAMSTPQYDVCHKVKHHTVYDEELNKQYDRYNLKCIQ